MPKIKARFRTFKGIPFAVEQFIGVQYRCRVCNRVFIDKKEFEAHLLLESQKGGEVNISPKAPLAGQNISAKALYVIDIHDHLKRDYLHLKDEIQFDPEPSGETTTK